MESDKFVNERQKHMNNNQPELISCPPDAVRVAEGLRDTGYEFNTAIADIIDNSIAAGAENISIILDMDPKGNIRVAIADDGLGMDKDGLINALTYGSKKRDDPSSLGKFGLGLKTASTAFCRKLTLVSRNGVDAQVLSATWDLDKVPHHNWSIIIVDASDEEVELLDLYAPEKSGTIVIWDNVDRLLSEYKRQDGAPKQKAKERYLEQLRQHIAMVYQRFLDHSDSRARNINIYINDVAVEPWDPFCITEVQTPIAEKVLELELPDGTKAGFKIRAFVLPRKEDFHNQELAKKARIGNDMQGIYVYRENRLIHGPDWMDMFRKEPHFTLCRVELSFNHKLDDAFKVDIKKSRILLATELYDWMRDKFLSGPRREAEAISRKGQVAKAGAASALLHSSSNNAIHSKANALKSANLNEYDGKTGIATVQNRGGKAHIKIKVVEASSPNELHIKPVPEITNGLLFEPAYISGNQGVQVNTSHPYYSKVYIPNRDSSVTIQGLDSLLWALCVAELGCISDETKRKFEEMRFEVSRLLRNLVEDMPDPEANE
jgi:hypothetical protein